MGDDDIVRRFKDGDLSVFEALLDQYEGKIFRLVYGLVCNYHDAQDLTQEVFVKVYQKLTTFNENSTLIYWMSRIARNHCLNFLRRKSLIRFISMEWLFSEKHQDFQDHSTLSSVEENYEQKERLDHMTHALSRLSYQQRELIVLSEIDEMAYKDISQLLKIPMGTVKSRLSRSKQALKAILEKEARNEKV